MDDWAAVIVFLARKSILKPANAFYSILGKKEHIVRERNICSRNTEPPTTFSRNLNIRKTKASRQNPACAKSAAIDSYDRADVWRRTGSSRHITPRSRSLLRCWMILTAVKLSQGSYSEDSKHHQQARLLEIQIYAARRCGSCPSLYTAEFVKQ